MNYQCVVLMPAGPGTNLDYLNDNIHSVNHHLGKKCLLIILDDSRQRSFHYAKEFPNVEVIDSAIFQEGAGYRLDGTIFAKEIAALKQIVSGYLFDCLLKIDTDTLITGNGLHLDILNFLSKNPDVGIVGAYKRRGDGTDKTAAMAAKGVELSRDLLYRRAIRRPRNLGLIKALRPLVASAESHGYRRGDTCTGGGYCMSGALLRTMLKNGFFDLEVLRHSVLGEDSLMALLCYAAGFRIADMPAENDVMAINWRGLPMPVEELVARNKKIVHPIKDKNASIEPAIRAFFQKRRAEMPAFSD